MIGWVKDEIGISRFEILVTRSGRYWLKDKRNELPNRFYRTELGANRARSEIAANLDWWQYVADPNNGRDRANCGPRALVNLTDCGYYEAERWLEQFGRKVSFTTHLHQMKLAIDSLGWGYQGSLLNSGERITLREFVRLVAVPSSRYLLHVHDHWTVVRGGKVWDSWQVGGRYKVDGIWRVFQNGNS